MPEWYCYIGSHEYGPVPLRTLQEWLRQGRIGPEGLVWGPGMSGWRPAKTVLELRSALESAPPERAERPRAPVRPHRGGLLLAMAFFGLIIFFPVALAAWILGTLDLHRMRRGTMDPGGYPLTRAAIIVAVIGTVVGVLKWLGYALLIALFVGNG